MKEIVIDDIKITLKQDYITRSDAEALIVVALEHFNKPALQINYKYNYIDMDNTFIDGLCGLCVEGYNDELRDEYDKAGILSQIIFYIKNADEAYDKLYLIADKMSSIDNVLENLLVSISEKLPKLEDLQDLSEKIPSEFKDAVEKYNSITHNDNIGE